MEAGEDPYAACIREVAEETGLAITDPLLRALLIVSVLTPPALWVIFVFIAAAPAGLPVSSEEGDLSWVDLTTLPTMQMPPDLPLILPRVFTSDRVLVVRAEYRTEDPTTMTRLEVMDS
jgi:8-oxo-dGTP pyrophosphatase MutT (NUDIX family)